MPAGLTTFADAVADGAPRTRIPVAKLGRFSDPRYGKFAITAQMVDSWRRNLAESFGGRVAIDLDHSSEKAVNRKTEAAAWITSLEVEGDTVQAEVEWTPLGEQAVREKRYLYISPTFVDNYKDEQGKARGDALIGAGLTNRPFLRAGMPALSLAAAPLFAEVENDEARRIVAASDSRSQMPELANIAAALNLPETATEDQVLGAIQGRSLDNIAKALKLDEGADQIAILRAIEGQPLVQIAKTLDVEGEPTAEKILAKVESLRTELAEAKKGLPAPKPLGELAREKGKKLLDADEHAQLVKDANAGKAAQTELHEKRFNEAFRAAVADGRAAPTTEQRFAELYEADPEATLNTLEDLPRLVAMRAAGQGPGVYAEDAPNGVDPERWALNKRVEAHMKRNDETDYAKALEAVTAMDKVGV